MTAGGLYEMPTPPDQGRDDRTLRALALVVGPGCAEASLDHLFHSRVEVLVASDVLNLPNGFLAVTATLNMLNRFVGVVELHVKGDLAPTLEKAVASALAGLEKIDSREGRSVRYVPADCDTGGTKRVATGAAVRVHIGDVASAPADDGATDADRNIYIAFDGWTCALRRGSSAGAIVTSFVPFGALAAACFAVAEVFKTLAGSLMSDEDFGAFRRRFTHNWRFSAWAMERLDDGPPLTISTPPDALPPLVIDSILQVGAGAVGNATVLAFVSTAAIRGDLKVLDPKRVDAKNLNRCYYFTETDVGAAKVRVLERAVTRTGLRICGKEVEFTAGAAGGAVVILSTVDNNEVRHRMQEVLPVHLIQGATGGTTVAVSAHSPGNGRSCLVCRHPDPNVGLTMRVPLSLAEAAGATGLTEDEVASGCVDGTVAITNDVISRVGSRSKQAAAVLDHAREMGQDLCGALGDLRSTLGTIRGPNEASVPFVSNLAGVLAAAEVVKLLMHAGGATNVPLLDNVFQIDLARDYDRNLRLAFEEPPRSDCALCQGRAYQVAQVIASRK